MWFVNIWDKPPNFDVFFMMESRVLFPNFLLYHTDILKGLVLGQLEKGVFLLRQLWDAMGQLGSLGLE